jgi:hypothetical protein
VNLIAGPGMALPADCPIGDIQRGETRIVGRFAGAHQMRIEVMGL